jgi:DNA helicase-2/ATP-dependent DNA helicase PcrA
LPEAHVEVKEPAGGTGGFGMSGYGASRFDEMNSFGSSYTTPGWQRAQQRKGSGGFDATGKPRESRGSKKGQPAYVPDGIFNQDPGYVEDDFAGQASPDKKAKGEFTRHSAKRGGGLTIEGELIAKSTGTASAFDIGARVFHQKFGNGNVVAVDGNKLTIRFDHAGEKRVVDSFVERV